MRIGGMDATFAPRSVAVIGTSIDPKSIGGRMVDFLKRHRCEGTILPINPGSAEVQGLTAYPSISGGRSTPDLAVITLPARLAVDPVDVTAQPVNQIDLLKTSMDVLFGDSEIDRAIIFISTVGLVADLMKPSEPGWSASAKSIPADAVLFAERTRRPCRI